MRLRRSAQEALPSVSESSGPLLTRSVLTNSGRFYSRADPIGARISFTSIADGDRSLGQRGVARWSNPFAFAGDSTDGSVRQ